MIAMTKHRIRQYTSLLREIDMLETQICAAMGSGEYVADSVRGSMKIPPFAQHTITVQGYGSSLVPKLEARKAKCQAECAAIEEFIAGVDDSITRQLLTWRYIDGRSVEETAEKVGYSRRQAGRRINDLFRKDVP